MIGSARGEGWAVHWKRDRTWEVRDCLLTFGISPTAEVAMEKVESAIIHGLPQPAMSAEEFRKRFRGGVFYPVNLHWGVPVP